MNQRELFVQSLGIKDVQERIRFLTNACAGDDELFLRVQDLLKTYERAESFLEASPYELASTKLEESVSERPGTQIGRYKLLEPIGEGGMGTVYMAEQIEPVHRRVALKLIKTGMDTKQVIARFEAERQALAVMDHPNIAKVFDAGATESGRPYFVMELVKGLPITRFCDEHQLDPKARLELFSQVCHAVQHAHQKGIIHRDLKPSNIMVAMYDDKPVPKVIDFGVAKATGGEQQTQKSFFTRFGQVVGTLEYMSPEQTQLNQLDVDTRSDIYSLGAILYELLSGSPPFEKEKLKNAALDEVFRMIREDEPEKPSTKISSSEGLAQISTNRHSQPQKLSALVRGDLDWIVMKAVDKDRARRYETANGFALDIQRFLNDEPVSAGPPSAAYRFSKFARRNSGKLIAASIMAALLFAGTGVSTWQAIRATSAEKLAKYEALRATNAEQEANKESEEAKRQANIADEVQKFWNEKVLGQADPSNQPNRDITLREVLDLASDKIEGNFEDQPLVEAAIRLAIIKPLDQFGENKKSLAYRQRILTLYEESLGPVHEKTLNAKRMLGSEYLEQGQFDLSKKLLNETLNDTEQYLGRSHEVTLKTYVSLGSLHWQRKEIEVALKFDNLAKRGFIETFGPEHEYSITAMTNYAVVLEKLGRNDESRAILEEALPLSLQVLSPKHPMTLSIRSNLAANAVWRNDFKDAVRQYRAILPVQTKILGDKSLQTLDAGFGLGRALWKTGNLAEAEEVLLKFYRIQKAHHPTNSRALRIPLELVGLYGELERFDEAEKVLNELARNSQDSNYIFLTSLGGYTCNLGHAVRASGRLERSGNIYERAIDCLEAVVDQNPNHSTAKRFLVNSLGGLTWALYELGDTEKNIPAHEQIIETFESIVTDKPNDADDAAKLAGYYCNLGVVLKQNRDAQSALGAYEKAGELLTEALENNSDHALANRGLQTMLLNQAQALTDLERHQDALKNFDRLLSFDLQRLRKAKVLIAKARVLARVGQHQASVDLVNSLDNAGKVVKDDLIYVAAVFSLASHAASTDSNLAPDDREELANKHAEHSLELLEAAVRTASLTVAQLEEQKDDEDFTVLRERKDYVQLLKLVDNKIAQKRKGDAEKTTSIVASTNDDKSNIPNPKD